jgi:hypothetical protein
MPVSREPAPVPTFGARRPRSRWRRTRGGLIAAALLPGALAAALVLAVGEAPSGPTLSARSTAPALARLAALAPAVAVPRQPEPLHPVIPVKGRVGIRVDDLEPLAGGIRPAPPGRIRIPAAGVDAGIEAVQGGRDGIEVPPQGWAGWYDAGPRPGERGRAVVIGHLDSTKGPGVFARVPSLKRGARIEVVDNRGGLHRYRVVGLTQVQKARFPRRAVYGAARRPVLVLVTCGGPLIDGHSYRDNILVYARAV